jgi:uncharacterized protein (DUF2236 family)
MTNLLTENDYSQVVSVESLESELSQVRAAAAGSSSGVFGPRSMTWQVDRESAIFFGAGRALLLQLAHPWVAAAIQQHSDTFILDGVRNARLEYYRSSPFASSSRRG